VRLGAVLPFTEPDGSPLGRSGLADGARRLAGAGFDSIWVFEALGRGLMLPDPMVALAVAATVTEGVELGTGVLQVPLGHPVALGHRLLTTRLVSGDRLVVGIGAGSTRNDFDAVGVPYEDRFRRFDAAVPVLRHLLATGRADGPAGADLTPWPEALGGTPLLLGTWGAGVVRAARDFDGWVASAAKRSDADVAEAMARYRAAGGTGRTVVTNIRASAGPELDSRAEGGWLDALAARLGHYAQLGFDDAVVVLPPGDERLDEVRALVS
jgi:alkanesulfonate monooxygenase SsuD/methylene tetrahydromethanopterin reductase-like flavin-dependent oxidoreductase (luciferase family)